MLWAIWCGACAASFVVLEVFVIATGRPTFSQFVWDLNRAYPIFGPLVGAALGGLLFHLFDWRQP